MCLLLGLSGNLTARNMAEQDLLALVKRLEAVAIKLESSAAPGGAGKYSFFQSFIECLGEKCCFDVRVVICSFAAAGVCLVLQDQQCWWTQWARPCRFKARRGHRRGCWHEKWP